MTKNQKNKGKPCGFALCDREAKTKGLCESHNAQRARGVDLRPLKRARVDRHVTAAGYVKVRGLNGERVYEHRLVMEQHLGRPLLEHETVHHKNGDRGDNRIRNLELWSTKQPYGQRVSDKLEYAYEIIRLYGGLREEDL